MVKRAKAATMDKKAREMASAGVRRTGAEKRVGRVHEEEIGLGREEKPSIIGSKTGLDKAGFGLVGLEKSWSVQVGVQGQIKDRGIAPPPLPVPIASYNT